MMLKRYRAICILALGLPGPLWGCGDEPVDTADTSSMGQADEAAEGTSGGTAAAGESSGMPGGTPTAPGDGEPEATSGGAEAGSSDAAMGGTAGDGSETQSDGMAGGESAGGGMMGDGSATAGATGDTGPTGVPTFTALFTEIFVPRCSGPICHSGTSGGNLVMTDKEEAYQALVSSPAEGVTLPGICEGMPPNCADLGVLRIAPGDPENSLLLDKVENPQPRCGCPMPTSPPPLSEAEVEQIRMWIMLGAPND